MDEHLMKQLILRQYWKVLYSHVNEPTNLDSVVGTDTATLSWTAPSDNNPMPYGTATPTQGLNYNLRVGTTPGGSDVLGPMSFQNPPSSPTDGLRKIAHRGLIQGTKVGTVRFGSRHVLLKCPGHRQRPDSPFAEEGSFFVGFTDINAGLPGVLGSSAAWGDYDNDGDLDFLLSGFARAEISRIYRNDVSGTFTNISAGLL